MVTSQLHCRCNLLGGGEHCPRCIPCMTQGLHAQIPRKTSPLLQLPTFHLCIAVSPSARSSTAEKAGSRAAVIPESSFRILGLGSCSRHRPCPRNTSTFRSGKLMPVNKLR